MLNRVIGVAAALAVAGLVPPAVQAEPQQDFEAFRAFYQEKYPEVELDEFANGVYAIDPVGRANWEMIEEFPPYEPAIEEGEQLFHETLPSGKTLASCFPGYEDGIRQDYPYFDTERGEVVTLELTINECREQNGAEKFKWKSGHIASVSAYLAYLSRGKRFDVTIPDDPRARAAYEAGKTFYYTKRGQLNLACADCHIYNTGRNLRTELLGPSLGHPTHWPVYRAKWGAMGTLHRRFTGCNKQVRAKPFPAQGEEYRNLEYFLTYMSNGLPVNGPGARK